MNKLKKGLWSKILILAAAGLVFSSCNKGTEPDGVTLTTLPVIENDGDNLTLRMKVNGDGASSYGFIFNTFAGADLNNTVGQVLAGSPDSDTSSAIALVEPSTSYYINSYAWVDGVAIYGNEITYTTGYAINQDFGGGKIAYILQPGDPGYDAGEQHGLIIAESYFGFDIAWGCEGTLIDDTETGFGTGQSNTNKIMAGCGAAGTAATLCDEYSAGGFTDWYLPSYAELEAIDENYDKLSGISNGFYWSSSESSSNNAWKVYLWPNASLGEAPTEYPKSSGERAIAVRSF